MASREDKQERIKNLLAQADTGIKEVFESERYKKYLSFYAQFHRYSFRNAMLIQSQLPQATYVAGYNAWQKTFNRQVQKGETGIAILGYSPRKVTQDVGVLDNRGRPVMGADGQPKTEKVEKTVPAFVPVYVYDVSQTKGEPLPTLVNELQGSTREYDNLVTALKEISPFPIEFEKISGDVKGYCDFSNRRIAVNEGMSQVQTIKTIIHEITHVDLHMPDTKLTRDERPDRMTREVEAESTAYVVCSHYGIDTSEYSFPYLASWSSSKELPELQASLERIQRQTVYMLDKVDARMEELSKDYTKELTAAQDKARLDSVIHDNDIDLDREKTREQLGFNDNKEPPTMGFHEYELAAQARERQDLIEPLDLGWRKTDSNSSKLPEKKSIAELIAEAKEMAAAQNEKKGITQERTSERER